MELLESNDQKNLLMRKSAQHKKDLEDEVKVLSENTQKIITNALIIGGTLAITYILIRQFSGSKTKSKRKSKAKRIKRVNERDGDVASASVEVSSEPGVIAQIGSAIAAQATVFLLDLAKDKLSSFLQSHFNKQGETTDERS